MVAFSSLHGHSSRTFPNPTAKTVYHFELFRATVELRKAGLILRVEPDDIAQPAYLRLYLEWPQLDTRSDTAVEIPAHWQALATVIVRNLVLDQARSANRRPSITECALSPDDAGVMASLGDRETPLSFRDRLAYYLATEYLDAADEDSRQIFMRRAIDGDTFVDIAVAMKLPLSTVHNRFYRTRKALAAYLEPLFEVSLGNIDATN